MGKINNHHALLSTWHNKRCEKTLYNLKDRPTFLDILKLLSIIMQIMVQVTSERSPSLPFLQKPSYCWTHKH